MLPVIAGIEGTVLTARERELFTRLQPAGYILFTRNIVDYELTRELTDELRALTAGPDVPVIAIDQEGGRVVRTADIDVRYPSAAELAATECSHLITQAAWYNAQCLYTLGVNTNFAPVLDIGSAHANALPSRCWGYDSQSVTTHGGVWNRAHLRAGIATCGKHFPGMGAAECDPHFDLPVLHGSCDSFLMGAAIPFNALMPELPSMMIAHLLIPEIDPELPTSLSPALVQQFLRDRLGYEGVVFTDDLCMGAIAKRYTPAESAALALRAGCDLPLICHNVCDHLEAAAEAILSLPQHILQAAGERIERFRMGLHTRPPMPFIQWREYLADLRVFNARVPALGGATPGSPVQDY
ncbi:MAG: glycoside hydrolase family 3 protein [Akkermansia sp.]|nr:glycoside hydrolase family 3 protein [Akkermansia sp.]